MAVLIQSDELMTGGPFSIEEADQEAAVRDREDRLLKALASAEVGWWDWDIRTDQVVANPELAEVYGVPTAMALDGAPIADFLVNVHPADRPVLQDGIAHSLATGAPFREEYRLVRPDGKTSWVSARGRALRDEKGVATSFPGVVVEITDRKAAEAHGRDADMGRELALAAARLGWFDHKPDKGERFYDARAIELMGVTREEVTKLESVLKHIHPDDLPGIQVGLRNALDPNRSGPYRQTFRVLLPDEEERWITTVGRTQFENGVCTRFMGVLEDVTERVRAESYRRLLINELNHRVKNTLAVMQSLVDSTLRNTPDVAEARSSINARIRAYGRAQVCFRMLTYADVRILTYAVVC